MELGKLNRIEFYTIDEELWCKTDTDTFLLDETNTEFIQSIYELIHEFYPKAYEQLMKVYQKSSANVPYFKYLVVRRFCKCNFGKLDTTKPDVSHSMMNMEKVECPLRGECQHEGIICCPKFDGRMTKAEERVMKLVYEGLDTEDISERLCLSPKTTKNHIYHVFMKLGIHTRAEFIKYSDTNNIFNSEQNENI